jgi:hypothetical protein
LSTTLLTGLASPCMWQWPHTAIYAEKWSFVRKLFP